MLTWHPLLSQPLERLQSQRSTRHDEHYFRKTRSRDKPSMTLRLRWHGSCERHRPKSASQAYLLFTMSMSHRSGLPRADKVLFLCELACCRNGGARRDRTDDLKLAKLALSQLSYGPDQPCQHMHGNKNAWWAWEDLNFRPHAYQARALTN